MGIQKTKMRFGLAGVIGLMAVASGLAEGVTKPYFVSTDFDGSGSTTRGIQEAIEALPAGGGTVYVPPGDYMLERTINLRQGVQLIGAGRATRLWKAPVVIVPLAEDVSRDAKQDYVVVTDPKPFRPGMAVHPCDTKGFIQAPYGRRPWIISKVDGNRVHMVNSRHYTDEWPIEPFRPTADLKVSRAAALMTRFTMIVAAPDCLIENIAVDGNLTAQTQPGMDWRDRRNAKYPDAFGRGIRDVGTRCTVRRCWVYDSIVNISCSAGRALITDCDISGGWQGIHPGAGPLIKIVNNLIHDHVHSGIYMCMGNFGCIISQNHIYNNGVGLNGLGCRVYTESPKYQHMAYLARDGDHYHIISENIIFDNMREGIATEGGRIGPKDYVITGNIVMNNNKAGGDVVSRHNMPAGIALYNAQNCVLANNRCYDDQDEFGCGELIRDAPAGSWEIKIKFYRNKPVNADMRAEPPNYLQFRLVLEHGGKREEVNVTNRHNNINLQLDAPLMHAYPLGTVPRILKSQQWGIIAAGPESRNNVIMGNQCSENLVGGLLYRNPGGAVVGNVGDVAAIASNLTFMQNVHPAAAAVGPVNAGFEGPEGWVVTATAAIDGESPRSGRSALKISSGSSNEAVSHPFDMQPNTRYRLTGWVRTASEPASVALMLASGARQVAASPAQGGHDGADAVAPQAVPGQWICHEALFITGAAPEQGTVLCRYTGKAGAAWFDDIQVEELAPYPLRAFGAAGARLTGGLDPAVDRAEDADAADD